MALGGVASSPAEGGASGSGRPDVGFSSFSSWVRDLRHMTPPLLVRQSPFVRNKVGRLLIKGGRLNMYLLPPPPLLHTRSLTFEDLRSATDFSSLVNGSPV